jgi:hypothetical protein
MNSLTKTLFLSLLLWTSQLLAQAPEGINYQAVIRNGGGTLITNTTVAIQVKIRQGSATGTIVYQERHSVVTSAYGVVNLVIGGGTVQVGTFPSINWSSGTYYVDLGVDFNNGTSYQNFGAQQLISVPYALYAKNAGNQLNQWRYGNIAPTTTLGNYGDFYLDVITGNVYYKDATGNWILTGNIKGPVGPTGAQGPSGASGPAGTNGANGTNGTNGLNTLVKTSPEAAGTNCTTGGVKIEYGLDANSNGVLDATEINSTLTKYVCNGAVGATGPQGATGATGQTGATGAQGPQGIQGATGPSGASGPAGTNGTNGQNTLVKTTTETAGANCTTGGMKVEYGLDANSNGVLDANEINATLTKYVCNGAVGATGPQGATGATGQTGAAGPAGATGPTGATGPQGPQGIQGATGPQGIAGTNGTNGTNGQNTLVKTTTETAGANCTTGGVKMEYGLDANSNGVLDLSEINATLTKYVCNGATGATGPQGATGQTGAAGPQGATGPQGIAGTNGTNGANGQNTLVKTTTEVAGANCTTGGMKVEYGLDANSNGVLDANEINATLTKYVCNGAVGATGATGQTGAAGPAGATGATGATGPQGPQGIQGATGPQGIAGTNGTNGTNGQNTLVKTTTETAGANCTTGGVKMEYGLDANSNGVLDLSEINATLTKYVCNGAEGATGQTGAAGPQGPQGIQGIQGATGPAGANGTDGVGITSTTDNGNGTFTINYSDGSSFTTINLTGPSGPQGPIGLTGATGAQGIQGLSGATGPAGTNGLNSLIKTTTEPAGSNCANGGTKIETGLDANGNGSLDAGEVNASQTQYVCNGASLTTTGSTPNTLIYTTIGF